MRNSSVFAQTWIYFKKTVRIAVKEKFWKFVVFAAIIAMIVSMVVGENMFTTYESTKSGFFSIACASIWIGIFNSIQNVCKEHEIIRSEYRSGMKLTSYITANVMWQFIICAVQSLILISISCIFVDYSGNGIIFNSPLPEYFITILLITFGADVMGIMISSISGNPTTAMTIMPFVLIIQLIMSGVLFELSGWTESVAYVTLSKWGMSAFGSIADLNSNAYPLSISLIYPQIIKDAGDSFYDHTTHNLFTAWGWCAGISAFSYIASIVSLRIKNHDS